MPIITKPSVIEKNVPASFSLSKSSLAAVTSVAASPWFGDTANWKKVTLNYLSQEYGEMLFVSFDATQVSPTSTWLAPAICQDIFEIVSISITDFANGTFRVPTSELTVVDFDVDMSAVAPTGSVIVWTPFTNYTLTANGGLISSNVDVAQSGITIISDDTGISTATDFELIYNINSTRVIMENETYIGFSNSEKTLFDGLFSRYDENLPLFDNVTTRYTHNTPLTIGNNVVKFVKVGTTVTMNINGNDVFSASISGFGVSIRPAVRFFTDVTLVSAHVADF